MTLDPFVAIGQAHNLLQKLGLELAFVDPLEENGLDSVDGLVRQLESVLAQTPEPIPTALLVARTWIDERLQTDGRFSATTIARFLVWQPWLDAAVNAWEDLAPIPTLPAVWLESNWLESIEPQSVTAASAPESQQAGLNPNAVVKVAVSNTTIAAALVASPTSVTPSVLIPAAGSEQTVSVIPADSDVEMLQLFCAEAQDLLQEIEQGVLVLEGNPTDAGSIDSLFRAFHTLKGNVGIMKLNFLQQLTHELESLLDAARQGKFRLGRDAITVILGGADILKRFVAELANQINGVEPGRSIALPIPAMIASIRSLLSTGSIPVDSPSVAPVPVVTAPSAPLPPPAPKASPAATPVGGAGIVRVDTLKLDGLIDLVGELVIAQSMVVQNPELASISSAHLSRCLSQLRGITTELQRMAMSLRMVPIRNTFQKVARLVRDLAVQQGKEIQLVLEGEDTELDRTIVEELSDPLIHMIRNSADHGIEMPDARIAAGKLPTGTITLKAHHQGGFIVIQIQDDGRGLDATRIFAKAIERGLVSADHNLDRRGIYDLIFAAGFSTAERVTDLSGRGVGMDVVRRNIEKLRGKIEIDSRAGEGTTFTMYLPLTLAIIEGVLVGIGEERYVIPTLSVRESFRPLPGMVTTVHGRGEMVNVRGQLTPILRLGEHLHTPFNVTDPTQGIIVVVESGQDARCLFVDELIGKQEVVIKSLGDTFRNQTDFAGAAILGDGRVGLILNVNALVKLQQARPVGDTAV